MRLGVKKDVLWLSLIGLGGVSVDESYRAQQVGEFFSHVIIVIAVCLLLQWQLGVDKELSPWMVLVFNTIIFLFFVIQYVLLLYLVQDKHRFMRRNWLLPIIIVVGMVVIGDYANVVGLLRKIRPFFAFLIFMPSLRLMLRFLTDGKLWTTFMAAGVLVVMVGILVAGIDPSIHGTWDGIWWALATVSTVGYGDVVPSSWYGRLIGAGLIVLGLGVFVVITANFLSIMLRKEKEVLKEKGEDSDLIEKDLTEIKMNQQRILDQLAKLNKDFNK